MKTLLFLFCVTTLLLQSCETDIPEVDQEAPTFGFRLSGDGYDETFDKNFDPVNKTLYLKYDVPYDFVFSSNDEGGILSTFFNIQNGSQIDIALASDAISQQWEVQTISQNLKSIVWPGLNDTPKSFIIVVGTLTVRKDGTNAEAESIPASLYFAAYDYGGEAEDFNIAEGNLSLFISTRNQTTELVTF